MMAVFLFIAHEKGFKFHAQPQTGAYSCLNYDSLDDSKRCNQGKKSISSGRWSKSQNGDQNRIMTPDLPDCNILPFFKGF